MIVLCKAQAGEGEVAEGQLVRKTLSAHDVASGQVLLRADRVRPRLPPNPGRGAVGFRAQARLSCFVKDCSPCAGRRT